MSEESKIVFWIAWGDHALREVARSFEYARSHIEALFVVVTDAPGFSLPGLLTLNVTFEETGFFRKAEVFAADLFPRDAVVLFLDTDTCVLGSVDLGFSAAAVHGIALSPAPTYSLDEYRATARVLVEESVPAWGQLLYNSGVVFFKASAANKALFVDWLELCRRHAEVLKGDQEALTIVMEKGQINPYVLSKSYNLRGMYEPVIGETRIWHDRKPPPHNLNSYRQPYPPRLLAKSSIRALRRSETHSDSLQFFVRERVINPLYRFVRRTPLGQRLLGF